MGIHFDIHLVGKAHATRCCNSNLSLSPSSGGRLGWGWLLRFRSNQILAIRRTTLSPALSRRTGEGAGCKLKQGRLKTLRFEFGRNKLAPPIFRRPLLNQNRLGINQVAWALPTNLSSNNQNQTTAEWVFILASISRAKPTLLVAATANCPFPRLAGEG